MTFGEFVRTTVDNFRRFFAAPFAGGDGTGGGPHLFGPSGRAADIPGRTVGSTEGQRTDPASGNADAHEDLPPFLQTRVHSQPEVSATTGASAKEPAGAVASIESTDGIAHPAGSRRADDNRGESRADASAEAAPVARGRDETAVRAENTESVPESNSDDEPDDGHAVEPSPVTADGAAGFEGAETAETAENHGVAAHGNPASTLGLDPSGGPTASVQVESGPVASSSRLSTAEPSAEATPTTAVDTAQAPGLAQESGVADDIAHGPADNQDVGETADGDSPAEADSAQVSPASDEGVVDPNVVASAAPNSAGDTREESDPINDKTQDDEFDDEREGDETGEDADRGESGEASGSAHAEDRTIVQGALELPDETIPPEIPITVRETSLPLTAVLESLLFVADEPVEIGQLAKALDLNPKLVTAGLARLELLYRREERGLRLLTLDGRHQLVTLPAAAGAIEDFLNLDLTTRLSGPALETLAVIAYRQPVTRAQVESVRGVDCSGVLRSLLQRGLVEEAGRLETVGRPILYGVTDLFMQHFGLTGLDELPELNLEDADTLWAATELLDDPDALDAETAAQLAAMRDQATDARAKTEGAADSDGDGRGATSNDDDSETDAGREGEAEIREQTHADPDAAGGAETDS